MNQPTTKKNLYKIVSDRVLGWVVRYKWAASIAAASLLVAVLVVVILRGISQSNEEKAGRMYDISQSYINSLRYVTNQSERQRIYQDQINNMNVLVQNYPGTVAATRARLYLGRVFYEEAYTTGKVESVNTALSYYRTVIQGGSAPFYKALALVGSAQCHEQKNDYAGAFQDYSMLVGQYRGEGFAPLALIGMARSKEMIGDIQNAIAYYRQMVKDYPGSIWNRYAWGKIYFYSEPSQQPATPVPANNSLPFNP